MSKPENPFGLTYGAEEGTMPFARGDLVREIFDCLGQNPTQGPECFSLVGARYVGKTTVLRSLMSTSLQSQFLEDPTILRPIFLNCADLPTNRLEVFRLFSRQLIDIARGDWGIPFQHGLTLEYEEYVKSSQELGEVSCAFEGLLKDLSLRHHKQIVFVLDDFEKLLALFTESDIQLMRDIFSNTKHALVVASPKHIREHSPKTFPSKFYDIFKSRRVEAFSRDQAYNYLTQTTLSSHRHFSQSEKETILRKAGQHPHFLRIYAAEAWSRKLSQPEEQPIENFDRVDRKAGSELSTSFLALWESLDKDLQVALYRFATGQMDQKSLMMTLQCLESEHALAYRTPDGRFEIMGELFREFVVSQTELIDHLLQTDFYRAGLTALKEIREARYLDTDPQYYYQKAFQRFVEGQPDYDSANAMIRSTFECLLNVMVKRSEQQLGRPFTGGGFRDKMRFIEEAFDVEDRISRLISEFWNVANSDGPHPGRRARQYNTQLRFYILSGAIQYLLNSDPRAQT